MKVMSNARTLGLIFSGAVIAGVAVYWPQQGELRRFQADNRDLVRREAQLTVERDETAKTLSATRVELRNLQGEHLELTRLREEIVPLRAERDALKQRLAQVPAAAPVPKVSAKPGFYRTKGQLAFAGYTTPQAALESMTWAMLNGDYDQSVASLGPELQAEELAKPKGREEFEARRKVMAPLFKGMQILATKTFADDAVELKVKVDADPAPDAGVEVPRLLIQPMVKVGNEWKLGNAERAYEQGWDAAATGAP